MGINVIKKIMIAMVPITFLLRSKGDSSSIREGCRKPKRNIINAQNNHPCHKRPKSKRRKKIFYLLFCISL